MNDTPRPTRPRLPIRTATHETNTVHLPAPTAWPFLMALGVCLLLLRWCFPWASVSLAACLPWSVRSAGSGNVPAREARGHRRQLERL